MTNPLYVNELERKVQQLQQELDEIKSVEFPRRVEKVAEGWRGKCERLQEYLEASQAREAQLREAILQVCCDPEGEPCFVGSTGDHDVIRKVLALPTDDTALKARLQAERERCAKACDARRQTVSNGAGLSMWSHDPASVEASYCADTLRNLGDE